MSDLRQQRKLAGVELTRPALHESDVSDTIVQQMGGFGRLKAMIGAKVFKLPNGIGIKWPNKERSRGNYVEIRLEPSDTYTMEFFNQSGASKKSVKVYEDVYFDSLVDIFEKQTGWFLSIGGSKKPAGSGRPASPELPPTGTKHESNNRYKYIPFTRWGMKFALDWDDAKKKGQVVPEGENPSDKAEMEADEMDGDIRHAKSLPDALRALDLDPVDYMESKLDELRALLGETSVWTLSGGAATKAWIMQNEDEIQQIIDDTYGRGGHGWGGADDLMKALKKHGWTRISSKGSFEVDAVSPGGKEVVRWEGRMPTEDEAYSGYDQMTWWPSLVREMRAGK